MVSATPASGRTSLDPALVTVAMVTQPTSLAGKMVEVGRTHEGLGRVSTS